MKILRFTISQKITLTLCVILAVVFTGVFTFLDANLRSFVSARIRTALLKETLLIKLFLEKDFSGYPRLKEMGKIADTVGYTVDSRVTLIGLDGTVLGDSDIDGEEVDALENHLHRPEIQQALRDGTGESVRFSTTVQSDMLYVAAVFGKEEPAGLVRLALPLSDIDTVSARIKNTFLSAIVIGFFLAVLGSFIASSLMTRSIKEMASAARTTAKGGPPRKVVVRTNDEVGELARAFNHMTSQLSIRIKEVTSGKNRLETVLLSMFDGVMVVDERGEISLVNKALKSLLKVNSDTSGKKPFEVLRNNELQEMVDKVLKDPGHSCTGEITVLMPEEKKILVHGSPIAGQGNVEGAVLVFHDITDLRRLEKIRRDFVANVSHELRTPVSNIKGFTETLLGGAINDKDNAEEFIRIIQCNSDRLVKLVDDLLDLSKIESGKISPDLRPCSVKAMAEEAVADISAAASEKGISVINEIQEGIRDVMADRSMLAQVFFNLLDNSVKYTPAGGSVAVSAAEGKDLITVTVADSGQGISREDIPRIFERFYRVDKGRSREMGGTGLGLSIVKHIVTDHGGKVFVESTPGKGSAFSFTLPKAPVS